MTKTYVQIQKQIETLQREADKLKRQEIDDVIAKIKDAITVYDLTAADLGFEGKGGAKRGAAAKRGRPAAKGRAAGKRAGRAKSAAEVKFRDEAGNTWGGRGPRPQWLRDALGAGKALQDFAV
jgi:DNA-binding protein H-NS